MARRLIQLALVATFLAACGGTTATLSPTAPPSTPTATAAPTVAPVASPAAAVPAGRILSFQIGADGLEHYFSMNTDGSDRRDLFSADGCGCARFSPDGTHIVTMGPTGHDTYSLMTMQPDGSDREVVDPPIETLSLAQPVSNASFERIAFSAWDETNPANDGLYIAAPDLADLGLVRRLRAGEIAMEPFGVTPDGSKVLYFTETGPDGGITHAGDLYAIDSDGTNLRQLNQLGRKVGFLDVPTGSLSPDGSQVAYAAGDGVYVINVEDGANVTISSAPGFAWAVSWSPTGEWIAFTRQHGSTSVVSLIRPDGADEHEISAIDASDEVKAAVWSPDGQHLLVRRGHDEMHDLWIMDLEGAFIRQVTNEPGRYGNYSWGASVSE